MLAASVADKVILPWDRPFLAAGPSLNSCEALCFGLCVNISEKFFEGLVARAALRGA